MALDDGQFAFLSQGVYGRRDTAGQEEYCYPGSLYEGIELFLDLYALSRQPYPLFQESEVSPEEIMEHLHTHRRLYLASTPPTVQTALEELWQLRDSQELGLIKLLSARLLWEVKRQPVEASPSDPLLHPLPGGHCQETREILCADLSRTTRRGSLPSGFK